MSKTALVTTTDVSAAAAVTVTVAVAVADECDDAGGEGDAADADPVDGTVPYDVLTHFLAD